MNTKTLLLVLGLALPTSAFARTLEGVDVPESLAAGGQALKLNGAGLRKKFIVKVYVGGLYLGERASSAQAVLGADKPWAVQMTFLRGVDKGKILNTYKEGFEKNSKEFLARLQPGLVKLNAGLADMKSGGVMTVTHVPGKGTTVTQPGGVSVSVEGKEFGEAMLRNWLGTAPADNDLKAALLAGK